MRIIHAPTQDHMPELSRFAVSGVSRGRRSRYGRTSFLGLSRRIPLMQIARDKVVSMDYTLTGPAGNVLDTSQGREPLVYMQGAGNIIPGLERELEGKSVGDQIKVTIPAEHAYGKRDDRMVQ